MAQRAVTSRKEFKSQLINQLVRTLSGEDKSKLMASFKRAGSMAAALMRSLLSDVSSKPNSTQLMLEWL